MKKHPHPHVRSINIEGNNSPLLHLTSIFGTEDNHLLLGEVDGNGGGGGHTGGEAVGGESTGVVDDIVGVEVLELLARGPDEHVTHEESMVCASADNANVDAVTLVPAGETIDNVDTVAGVEVVDGTLTVDAPDLRNTMLATCFANIASLTRPDVWKHVMV